MCFHVLCLFKVLLTAVFISITVGLTFLNLTPLNEAIMAFQDFRFVVDNSNSSKIFRYVEE